MSTGTYFSSERQEKGIHEDSEANMLAVCFDVHLNTNTPSSEWHTVMLSMLQNVIFRSLNFFQILCIKSNQDLFRLMSVIME